MILLLLICCCGGDLLFILCSGVQWSIKDVVQASSTGHPSGTPHHIITGDTRPLGHTVPAGGVVLHALQLVVSEVTLSILHTQFSPPPSPYTQSSPPPPPYTRPRSPPPPTLYPVLTSTPTLYPVLTSTPPTLYPVLTSTPPPTLYPVLTSTPHPMRRFQPIIPDPDGDNILCYENGAMFLFSNFQYIILAVILSNGPPYRQPFYCNCKLVLLVFHHCQSLLARPPALLIVYLMVAVGILLPVCIFLTLAPSSWLLVVSVTPVSRSYCSNCDNSS